MVDDDGEDDGDHCLEGHADQGLGQEEGGQPILARLDFFRDLHAADDSFRALSPGDEDMQAHAGTCRHRWLVQNFSLASTPECMG